MKLNILGTEYEFAITSDKEDVRLCDNDGYCDSYEKRIAIEGHHNENAPGSISDFEAMRRKVKRHEIVHAFFNECGLQDYSNNEQLVDWIARLHPRLHEAFKAVDADA